MTLRGCRILVVEDEFYLADDTARFLSSLGAEIVGPVPSRDEALEVLGRSEHVDVAVLDVKLRDQTVAAVAEALTQRNIPFLFATGYDQAMLPPDFQEAARVEKPFTPKRLIAALQEVLQAH